ncbi:hypothetical protein BDD43_2107 [Mucilaginibacter gracilis]|uniref:Uncharacterized protein n=1 Tax=Mucilaginibacter gracilis TaxID=423350 RepID=A0A495IZ05_9SPHI|nr:hypothetical protein [Mucilaginibacter gracilis]RKR81945.1 hypothetical protein BDD43_2107 [Mucilaginibacter gracilis]
MKTYKTTSVSQLVASFDNELKNLLLDDLKAIKTAKQKLINAGLNQGSLTAA